MPKGNTFDVCFLFFSYFKEKNKKKECRTVEHLEAAEWVVGVVGWVVDWVVHA
jgi:hemolysin-activating ACP:hemolysin acyltransferase